MRSRSLESVYIMSIPYVAGLSCIQGVRIAGLSYHGFIWLGYLVFGLLLLVFRPRVIPFPWKLWLPWNILVALSLAWGSMLPRWNVQAFLQIFTPFVVGMVASFTITDAARWNRFVRGFGHSLVFLAMAFVAYYYGPLTGLRERLLLYGEDVPAYGPRPAAMTLAIIGCLYLISPTRSKVNGFFVWGICLAIVVLTGSRMGILVVLAVWMLMPQQKQVWRRFSAVTFICVLGLMLFYSPMLQKRFFYTGSGKLSQLAKGEFADEGRFEFWEASLGESKKHIVLGAGVGESDLFISDAFAFKDIRQVHNDYLRVLFELGIVGLGIFILTISVQMWSLFRMARSSRGPASAAAAAAFLCIVAWLMFSLTDNSLIYGVYFTHPMFVIIGAAYGMKSHPNEASDDHD